MKFTVYILVRKKGEPAVITGKSRCKKSIKILKSLKICMLLVYYYLFFNILDKN